MWVGSEVGVSLSALWPLVLGTVLVVSPVAVGAQPAIVRVRVVEEATNEPLPNAEIMDRVSGTRRFTNAAGEALFPRDTRSIALRVRQLGFRYVDGTIGVGVDSATFALKRVAYILPPVHTTTTTTCSPGTDSTAATLSAAVLEQLRAGAERYEAFRREYPFRVRLERLSGNITPDSDVKPTRASMETEHSDRWGERYAPNRIVAHTPRGFSVPILFISALADSVFWDRHCFSARGVESLGGTRVIRLHFAPNGSVRTPDWEGAALVDSASSMLRRVEFRLTGLKAGDRPRRLEGYTTFTSPTPFIVVPDTTTAIWWRRDAPEDGDWGNADAVQRIALKEIAFLRSIPPGFRRQDP